MAEWQELRVVPETASWCHPHCGTKQQISQGLSGLPGLAGAAEHRAGHEAVQGLQAKILDAVESPKDQMEQLSHAGAQGPRDIRGEQQEPEEWPEDQL